MFFSPACCLSCTELTPGLPCKRHVCLTSPACTSACTYAVFIILTFKALGNLLPHPYTPSRVRSFIIFWLPQTFDFSCSSVLVLDFRKTIISSWFCWAGRSLFAKSTPSPTFDSAYTACLSPPRHPALPLFPTRVSVTLPVLNPSHPGWRDAPRLGELADLAEDPGLIPNTHVRQFAITHVSSCRKSEPSSSHAGHFYTHSTYTHTQAYTPPHKTKSTNEIFKSLSPWWKAERPSIFTFIPVCFTWACGWMGEDSSRYLDWV